MLACKSVENDAPPVAHRLERDTRLQANEQIKKQAGGMNRGMVRVQSHRQGGASVVHN